MQYAHIRLGTKVTDKFTGIVGTLTHLNIDISRCELYSFRPVGMDKDTGLLRDAFWISRGRIEGGEIMTSELPFEVLGTQVKHKHSGAKGTVFNFTLHVNGCIHLEFQPAGRSKAGTRFPTHDNDLRELEGPAIPKLKKKELDASRVARPSPAAMTPRPRG